MGQAMSDNVRPLRILPGGMQPSGSEVAVAGVILGGAALLWALRRGLKGLGPVELAGSTLSGLEFFGYLMVVGGTIRVLQTQFPDNPVLAAINFIY
jgi:hypothetical protein